MRELDLQIEEAEEAEMIPWQNAKEWERYQVESILFCLQLLTDACFETLRQIHTLCEVHTGSFKKRYN
jgi:hypothetical protein